jgi:hypothetical protein
MPKRNERSKHSSNAPDDFVRIIAYDEDGQGESFWAKPLGNMLYEVQNIVMFAPGLHPEDIVRCVESKDSLPEVVEVVRRSQVRTISVIFSEQATTDQIVDVLWELGKMGVPFEKAADRVVALGVPGGVDFKKAIKVLEKAKNKIVEDYDELD